MRTIHKWQLPLERTAGAPRCVLEMPRGAMHRAFAEQHGVLCLWAEVDTEQPTEKRVFEIYGTGHEIPVDPISTSERRIWLGTTLDQDGFVWHLFLVFGVAP
jgi:hypothetical protein